MSLLCVQNFLECCEQKNWVKSGTFSELFDSGKRPITIDFSHHKACAYLAEEAYNFDKEWASASVEGYTRVKEYDTNNHQTGFQGCVFENEDCVIISYRGTDSEDTDISNNVQMYFNSCPRQYEDAMRLYDRVKNDKRFKGKKILITGHSLGGSLAQLVASTPAVNKNSSVTAITFNPFGRGEFIENSGGKFEDFDNSISYVIENDVVGTYCKHPGRVVSYSVASYNDLSFTAYHGVEQFTGNEYKFEKAYNRTKDESSKSNNLAHRADTGILSSITSAICDFFCCCGNAIASFFGFGDESDSRRRLA